MSFLGGWLQGLGFSLQGFPSLCGWLTVWEGGEAYGEHRGDVEEEGGGGGENAEALGGGGGIRPLLPGLF